MHVDALLDSGQSYGGRAFGDCMRAARERGVPVVRARPGMRWSSGDGVSLDVLAPSQPFLADTGDDVNENSIVAMLRYDRPNVPFRVLFMGDAGQGREAALLGAHTDVRANVLKVGHHGSAYASTPEFIAAVSPHDAIVSVGRRNSFGHPAPPTLQTLERAGARVYRTDRCGALTLDIEAARVATMLLC
jgi:competence protein ComEC